MGRYISSVADFDRGRKNLHRDPSFSASIVGRRSRERQSLSDGGIRSPLTEDGMCSLTPPRTSSACEAVSLGDARGGAPSDPKKIIMKLHVNWGRASANQLKRELVDSGGGPRG